MVSARFSGWVPCVRPPAPSRTLIASRLLGLGGPPRRQTTQDVSRAGVRDLPGLGAGLGATGEISVLAPDFTRVRTTRDRRTRTVDGVTSMCLVDGSSVRPCGGRAFSALLQINQRDVIGLASGLSEVHMSSPPMHFSSPSLF